MNNLSQLGKAAIAFDAQRQALPGWRNPHPSSNRPADSVHWPIALLPNVERSDVYRLYESIPPDPSGSLSNPTVLPDPAQVPYMAILVCPTSPPPDNSSPYISYAGNSGGFVAESPNAGSPVRQWKGDGVLLDAVGGAPYPAARSSLDVISSGDGTSNTLLFTEKSGRDVSLANIKSYLGNGQFVFAAHTTSASPVTAPVGNWPVFGVFARNSDPLPTSGVINAIGGSSWMPSSGHPGGVIASFCDGRTVFVKDSVSPLVYAHLVTSDSRWNAGSYPTNTPRLNNWLVPKVPNPQPYSLSEGDY